MASEDRAEIDDLERAAAWRLRLVDANPADTVSANAAALLERLAEDLRTGDHAALWEELQAIGHWLAESGAISDFAEFAADYRAKIGVSEFPADAAAYLRRLLDIARPLI